MKKGIITTLVVTICMMLTATYAFAASSKTEKKLQQQKSRKKQLQQKSLKQKPKNQKNLI